MSHDAGQLDKFFRSTTGKIVVLKATLTEVRKHSKEKWKYALGWNSSLFDYHLGWSIQVFVDILFGLNFDDNACGISKSDTDEF